MKVIKFLLVVVCFVLFINTCQAEKYYCGDDIKNYNSADLYFSDQTAKQKCRWLKTDIIISDEPKNYTYNQCVADFNNAKIKYYRGMCKPVITKTHSWNGYNCQVQSIQGTRKVIQTSCDTDNPDITESAMDYFEKFYREQDIE